MAIKFVDSFDHYASADIAKKWTQIYNAGGTVSPTITAAAGRHGSSALRQTFSGSGVRTIGKTLGPTGNTCIMGFSFNLSAGTFSTIDANTNFDPNTSSSGSGGSFLALIRQAGANQIALRPNTNGTLSVFRGSTLLGAATVNAMAVATTYYIEMLIVIDPTVGVVELRVNGIQWLLLTGQNTRQTATATWDEVCLGKLITSGGGVTWNFDDFYVCDGSGSAPWNTFLGDVRVDYHAPDANGSNNASTPSTGTDRYATVADAINNDDTDYNTFPTPGDKDTYNLESLKAPGTAILGMQVMANARKIDAGVGTICAVIRHSGTDYEGASFGQALTYLFMREIYHTNPGTGAQMIEADFNVMELGIKRIG